jgi:hypothetical protein
MAYAAAETQESYVIPNSRTDIYPIKSLDRISLQAARILLKGALEHERDTPSFR